MNVNLVNRRLMNERLVKNRLVNKRPRGLFSLLTTSHMGPKLLYA